MKRPNFFLIGAPKCGTTSVAEWLAGHPRVFLPWMKEPDYFNGLNPDLRSLAEYERLYEGAGEQHEVVMDASTRYLDHPDALRGILAYAPDAKFLVMLRNPVEMCRSLHGQEVWNGVETEPDFERAWRLQDARREGRGLLLKEHAYLLQYFERCRLGLHLEQVMKTVPKERLLTLLLDDIIRDPRGAYMRILRFAGLPGDGRSEFPRSNEARQRQFPRLNRVLHMFMWVRIRLGLRRMGVFRRLGLSALNERRLEPTRRPLDPAFERELYRVFREEVERLETITGHDLSRWKWHNGTRKAAE